MMRASNRPILYVIMGSLIGLAIAFVFGWSSWPLNRHDYIILGAILVGALIARFISRATNRKSAS